MIGALAIASRPGMKQVVHFRRIRLHSFVDPPFQQREEASSESVGLSKSRTGLISRPAICNLSSIERAKKSAP
jgi:hypothetical protein